MRIKMSPPISETKSILNPSHNLPPSNSSNPPRYTKAANLSAVRKTSTSNQPPEPWRKPVNSKKTFANFLKNTRPSGRSRMRPIRTRITIRWSQLRRIKGRKWRLVCRYPRISITCFPWRILWLRAWRTRWGKRSLRGFCLKIRDGRWSKIDENWWKFRWADWIPRSKI